jgi:hypothetical protein
MRRVAHWLVVATMLIATLAAPVAAQDAGRPEPPELVTDRPDQTESATVVPRGYYQFELGWTHASFDIDGVESSADSFPETLVRIGLSNKVELRIGFDGYQWDDTAGPGSPGSEGFTDTSLGVKIGLAEEQGARPQLAVIAGLGLPSGAEELTDSRVVPAFAFSFAHTLSERFSLGYNLGALWLTQTDDQGYESTAVTGLWTVALGIGITERWGAFVEAFGNPVISALGESSSSLDGGFTYLVRPNVQLDLTGGFGLSGDAPEWFAGLGVSFRVPR